MADDKKYLRKVLGECRRGLPGAYVASVSRRVQLRVLQSKPYQDSSTVVLYAAKDNEVGTDLLLDAALSSHRRVLLPKIVPGNLLALLRINDRAELVPGSFGVLEPVGAGIVSVGCLGAALFCIPGVGFTPTGQRLGRGGGYFDRILAAVEPQTVTAGLAYSFQMLDQLPESPNDRRLNLIFTESAVHAGQVLDQSIVSG